jgi:hypothetical protein
MNELKESIRTIILIIIELLSFTGTCFKLPQLLRKLKDVRKIITNNMEDFRIFFI